MKALETGTSKRGKKVIMKVIPGATDLMHQIEVSYGGSSGPGMMLYYLNTERGRIIAETDFDNFLNEIDGNGHPMK